MIQDAKWIKSPINEEEACYTFCKEFAADKKVKKATLEISAMGMYRAYINGVSISDEVFTPYWTEYKSHTQYQSYDVTDMLTDKNELTVEAAEGWAVGYIRSGAEHRNHYAKNISVIFALNILFEDGTVLCVNSDEDVTIKSSQILQSSIYHGETVDRTAKICNIGNALLDAAVSTTLVPQIGEKVVEQDILYPVDLIVTPKGERVIDFGQNLAGYVEVHAKGACGDKIVLSHAEVLDKDGNFYTANLRTARQQNTYILSGGEEIFKPTFTWQGFRFIRLDEYPFDEVDLSDFKAIAVHSNIKRTGSFECGNEKINQLYHNIIWGQKSNFIDVPTDCPQRDERLGWTGDAQVFVRTAAINYDVERFFEKWLIDLAAGQFENGGIQWECPSNNLTYEENVSSAWGDAATICPWEIYLAYGNKKILENQFESMKKWVEYMHRFGDEEYLWLGGKQFGDWLAMDNLDAPDPRFGATPHDFISSAFFAYSTNLLIKAGKVLGRDMREYEELYKNIVKAFRERFIKDGVPTAETQTAYVIALRFGLTTDNKNTAKALAKMLKENKNKLTTGFVGTPHLLHALSENGYTDLAYDLLLQESVPSWLYQVNNGATTMWEHWDSIKEDGTFWPTSMNSFNHYAYGAVYDWIFGVSAGIKPLEDKAGYEHISIAPNPEKRLGFVKAGIETRFGKISSYWYYKGDKVFYEFEVPTGVTAEILLPDGTEKTVTSGRYMFAAGA